MTETTTGDDQQNGHGLPPHRVVCIGETWLGSDARAAFAALHRLGQSIHVVDEWSFIPLQWRSSAMRVAQRGLRRLAVRELTRHIERMVDWFEPQCLFVFKGNFVEPRVVRHYIDRGIPTINYYPDGGFLDFGALIPATLPLYDHVFTTKSFGIEDMRRELGVTRSTYLEHGFDPDIHRPLRLTDDERRRYACDVVFVGSWRPRKEQLLAALRRALPDLHLRVWGNRWENSRSPELAGCIMGHEILADEYAKAVQGGRIALALLTERRTGASSGDLTTARTFQIPACGAFMLHERTPDARALYREGAEAAFFESDEELIEKVRYYLSHDDERAAIAHAGHDRARRDGYAADARMRVIVEWLTRHRDSEWSRPA